MKGSVIKSVPVLNDVRNIYCLKLIQFRYGSTSLFIRIYKNLSASYLGNEMFNWLILCTVRPKFRFLGNIEELETGDGSYISPPWPVSQHRGCSINAKIDSVSIKNISL